MDWLNDAEVMAALDAFILNQQGDLNAFMETISDHMDETPIWGILVLYGKFVMYYTELRADGTEGEAYQEALARLANDKLTQDLVASIIGNIANRKVGA
jgi:hypothetical protein